MRAKRHTRRGGATRAYILLDIREGRPVEAAEVLQSMCGVVMTDPLEGSPDVVVVVDVGAAPGDACPAHDTVGR